MVLPYPESEREGTHSENGQSLISLFSARFQRRTWRHILRHRSPHVNLGAQPKHVPIPQLPLRSGHHLIPIYPRPKATQI